MHSSALSSDSDNFYPEGNHLDNTSGADKAGIEFSLAPPKTATLTKEVEVDLLRAGWNSYTRPPVFYALI